mgnify:CR=1 FL=1
MTYIATGIVLGVTLAYLDRYCFNDAIENWLDRVLKRMGLT